MILINFTFIFTDIERQKLALQNPLSEWVWLRGNIMFSQGNSIILLDEVPVVGLFVHMLNKIELFQKEEPNFILLSDDIHYNLYLQKENDFLMLLADWGYATGDISIKITEIDDFKSELKTLIQKAYDLNCIIVPETRNVSIRDNQIL